MRWESLGEDEDRDANGAVSNSSALLEQLRKDSLEFPFIVVKRMKNHPDIIGLAGPGGKVLTTCRIVTTFNEQNDVEVLSATFKIAVKQTVADNVHFGGLASPPWT